jgi:HicB_like antitoxin of bacterial toxin-antitoxin system
MRYAVVVEKAEKNYSAYVPDLPGCVATGTTLEQAEAEIRAECVNNFETPVAGSLVSNAVLPRVRAAWALES